MNWYEITAVISAFICITVLFVMLVKLTRLGLPKELSEPAGEVKSGIIYSFTGAMSPKAKESAYLHMPTYLAGIIYHIGTFTSLALFPLVLILNIGENTLPYLLSNFLSIGLALSSVAGAGIFIKRIVTPNLRFFSSADDYISNLLTTLIQITTLLLLQGVIAPVIYYLSASLLFLWMPFGKTKHLIYFFFARINLGYFYGRRGTWPLVKRDKI